MTDAFDDRVADMLLNEEERAEMHHIQHHFAELSDENERAVLGWRATSIYVNAFKREIVRLRALTEPLEAKHSESNCRCGHGDDCHFVVAICRRCGDGSDREVVLTSEME